MDEENVQSQDEVVEAEEITTEETEESEDEVESGSEDVGDDDSEDSQEGISQEEIEEFRKYKEKKARRQQIAQKATQKPTKQATTVDQRTIEQLMLRQDGYSKKEVDAIMRLGGMKAVDNPLIQAAIKTMRRDEKSKNASDTPSSKSPVYKKFTQEDMNKMSVKELEAILPKED